MWLCIRKMESVAFTIKAAFFSGGTQLHWFPSHTRRRRRTVYLNQRKKNNKVFASRGSQEENSPQFNNHDFMELEFGRLLGEDPKLTLAKIMGRKANPDVSYLDIEKSFRKKKKGKVVEIEELPFEVEGPKGRNSSPKLDNVGLVRPVPAKGLQFKPDDKGKLDNVGLVRPVPAKGLQFKPDDKGKLDDVGLVRPVPAKGLQFKPDDKGKLDNVGLVRPVLAKGLQFKPDVKKAAVEIKKPDQTESREGNVRKSRVPNVILRKPTVYKDDEDEESSSRMKLKSNLALTMWSVQVKEKFSDMTLLRKPEPVIPKDTDSDLKMPKEEPSDEIGNLTLLEQPHRPSGKKEEQVEDARATVQNNELEQLELRQPEVPHQEPTDLSGKKEEHVEDARAVVQNDGLEQLELRQPEVPHQESADLSQLSDLNSVGSKTELSPEAAVQGKPKRLDQYVKETSKSVGEEPASPDPTGHRSSEELGNHVDVSDFQGCEDAYWTKAEDLIKTGDRGLVELVSCNTKGFIVSFGTLVGFLPYRNLLSKWKFLAFESWLRQKGLDPSMYRQNLRTMTSYDAENKNFSPDSPSDVENGGEIGDKISPDMKLEDLLRIYDQDKIKFLSSFIGQKINAYVLSADRKLKKLIFSIRHKESEELAEKKQKLMARLQVGDIVKCRIQKITYFGIFVEVEGFSALIHNSELSWDATLNPSNYFKINQVVEAKIHQLNYAIGRIFLSLKEVTPDPLMDSLESVVGDHEAFDGRLEAAQTDAEWPELESLIKELQTIEGVQSVSKGRLFRSPGLAPTFQVYMASMFENQYKLLARTGNRIREVMVQTSLDKERMKSAIMTCANRVE